MALPTIITSAGLQPQAPASLLAQLLALVAATNPGYTVLPAGLIEDVSSTDVGAMVLIDQARVETVNSLTPLGANVFLLAQLGQQAGVPQGLASNTSVYVAAYDSSPGFPIPPGFTVSDGTYQYTVQDGGIIASDGTSEPLFCVATQPGSWAVPPDTVSQNITSVPAPYVLKLTNPLAGTPGTGAEDEEDYRSRVLQAGLASAQGMPTMLKTALGNVSGVQSRLVSIIQQTDGWEIIVGGNGDPNAIAYAIFRGIGDISTLIGSVLAVTGITQANPGVVTTDLNHGFALGTTTGSVTLSGVDPSNYNGTFTVTGLTETTFSIGVNTLGYPPYVSGGVVTPNSRNIVASIYDFPNTYTVPFVLPPAQTVTMTVTWNTSLANFLSQGAVAQLGAVALAAYVNGIYVGQPMNLFELQATFQAAIAGVLPPALLTRMVFAVSINGVLTAPEAGTGIIAGDPESYFTATAAAITINQG